MSTANRDTPNTKKAGPPPVADDDLPAGDMKPCSGKAVVLAAVAWGGWLLFIIGMAVLRGVQDPN